MSSAESTDSAVRSSLLGNLTSTLSCDQAALCDGHLSAEECDTALQGMARSKAPGSDGLPMEFYLRFWNVLGADLVAGLNSCFDSGSLSFLSAEVLSLCPLRKVTVLIRVIGGKLLS